MGLDDDLDFDAVDTAPLEVADDSERLTIDIDGFDPSIAPGTGTPSHGGFLYYEVLELLAGLARRGPIVGIDLAEVAPDYDQTATTSILAAQAGEETP